MVKFKYVILYVADVIKTIEFYENALGFKRVFVTEECDYGEINSGDVTISFASFPLAHSNFKQGFIESDVNQKPFGIELTFITENVSEVLENMTKYGAVIYEEIQEKPWSQKVAYVKDINGFLIEIATPMS